MAKLFRVFLLTTLTLCLTGCSLFSPVSSVETTYILNARENVASATPTCQTLLVTLPQANQAYNTSRFAYVCAPYQIAYFSKNQWADTPPAMILPLLVQSLQNTGHYHAVVAAPYSDYSDLTLNTQIINIQQEFLQKPSQVRVTIRAILINSATERVIATKQFTVVVCAPGNNPKSGAIAANIAVAHIVTEITQFCLGES